MAASGLVLLALLAYSNSFQAGFVFDNRGIILEDPRLRKLTFENLALIFTRGYWWPQEGAVAARPLTTLSYLFNYSVLGNADRPLGYHVVNFMLHCGNILLMYALLLRLLGEADAHGRREFTAFLAAALFAVHPANTEAVTNIVGRADLLAAASVLGALWLYLRIVQESGARQWPWLGALMLVELAGLFSKENAVVLPGILLIYDLMYRWQPRRARLLRNLGSNLLCFFRTGLWATLPPLILWIGFRVWLTRRIIEVPYTLLDNSLLAGNAWTARLTAVKIVGQYLALLVWPRVLSADYAYDQIPLVHWPFQNTSDWESAGAALVVLVLLAMAIREARRRRALSFFLLFFFCALAPTSNLIVLCGSTMAERFLYLPSVGFVGALTVAVGLLGERFASGNRTRFCLPDVCLAAMVLSCAARTFLRNRDWQDDLTFWQRLVETSPRDYRAQVGVARAIADRDKTDEHLDEVIDRLDRALAIAPDALNALLPASYYNRLKGDAVAGHGPAGELIPTTDAVKRYERSLALLLQAKANVDRATARTAAWLAGHHWDPAAVRNNEQVDVYRNLGQVWLRLGNAVAAIEAFRQLQMINPADPLVYRDLAYAYQVAGQRTPAAVCLWESTFVDPGAAPTAADELFRLYKEMDPQGCAVLTEEGRNHLNPNCPLVRKHICAAYAEMIRIFLATGHTNMAGQVRASALQKYGCTE